MKKSLISVLILFSLSVFSIAEENSQPEIIIKSSFEDINNLFDWAEDSYPERFSPSRTETFEILGYTARYYQGTSNYVGTKNERVYAYGDVFGGLFDAGAINNYLKRAYKPFEHVAVQVNNYQLNASSYQGTIGDVPVEFEVINNSLSTLVPALSSGEYSLSVVLDKQNVSTAITILGNAPIENPQEYIQDTVDGLGTDLEGLLVNLEPLNNSDLIAVINETLINLKAINLNALSTEELDLLSQIIEVNKLNGSAEVDRPSRTAKILSGCDLPKLSYSLTKAVAGGAAIAAIIKTSGAGAAFTGPIAIGIGGVAVAAFTINIAQQLKTIGEVLGDCLEPDTWLTDLLDSRLKRIAKTSSSFLNFQSEVAKTVHVKSEYQYPETIRSRMHDLKNLLNKVIDILPSSFGTLVSNLNKDGKIEYRNGTDFSITNISSSLVTLDSVNHNGKSLELTFKLAEGENKEQNFTFDLTDNAYDVDPIRISANISIIKECTPQEFKTESCMVDNVPAVRYGQCQADGTWYYTQCNISECPKGFHIDSGLCVAGPSHHRESEYDIARFCRRPDSSRGNLWLTVDADRHVSVATDCLPKDEVPPQCIDEEGGNRCWSNYFDYEAHISWVWEYKPPCNGKPFDGTCALLDDALWLEYKKS